MFPFQLLPSIHRHRLSSNDWRAGLCDAQFAAALSWRPTFLLHRVRWTHSLSWKSATSQHCAPRHRSCCSARETRCTHRSGASDPLGWGGRCINRHAGTCACACQRCRSTAHRRRLAEQVHTCLLPPSCVCKLRPVFIDSSICAGPSPSTPAVPLAPCARTRDSANLLTWGSQKRTHGRPAVRNEGHVTCVERAWT
jgi:hypothetical protein